MKRIVIASIIGIAASVASSYAQGVIGFDNYASANTTPVKYGSPAPAGFSAGDLVGDANIVIGLYAGANGSSTSALTLLATTFILPPNGVYEGPNAIIPASIWPSAGTIVEFQVRGWETVGALAGGGTYGTSQLQGASATWTENAAITGSANAANPFANGPMPLVLSVVPEPTTMALVGLGMASMLIFRRRQ